MQQGTLWRSAVPPPEATQPFLSFQKGMTMNSSRALHLLGLGLTTAALLGLGTLPVLAGGTNDNYNVTFTTPTPFLGIGSGDVLFQFNPEGTGAPPASVTGSNLTYSSDWQVSPFITTFGDTSIDYFGASVTINNTDTKNGFNVPVMQWGTTFGFSLNYVDPPGTTPSDFSVTLQKAGLNDLTLFDIQFDPAG